MSMSDSEDGSAGSVYAGPRVRVRRGRMGKVPKERKVRSALLTPPILIKGSYLPIRETSWSSRKIEWYA
jgi:hypothetical protein